MVADARESRRHKEQLSAILRQRRAAAAAGSRTTLGAAELLARARQDVPTRQGRIRPGAANYLLGLATFQVGATMDAETEKTKSCDMARQEEALVNEAEAGADGRPRSTNPRSRRENSGHRSSSSRPRIGIDDQGVLQVLK